MLLKLNKSHTTPNSPRMRVLQKFLTSFLAYYVIVSCISSVLGEIEPMPAESDVDFHDVSKLIRFSRAIIINLVVVCTCIADVNIF